MSQENEDVNTQGIYINRYRGAIKWCGRLFGALVGILYAYLEERYYTRFKSGGRRIL